MKKTTEEPSSFSQNIAAGAEEQLAVMEKISASSQSSSKLAEELNDQLKKFRL